MEGFFIMFEALGSLGLSSRRSIPSNSIPGIRIFLEILRKPEQKAFCPFLLEKNDG